MSSLFVKIQAILKARHISQAEFSRRIQVSPQRYSKWVHGTGEPGPDALLRIARVLNLTMESLVDDQLAPSPPVHVNVHADGREPLGNHPQPGGDGLDHASLQHPPDLMTRPLPKNPVAGDPPRSKKPSI